VSAGAINASVLAGENDDFPKATKKLADLWSSLTTEDVFKTDALTIGKIGLKWMGELSLGALTGTTPGNSLLDTSPLHELIKHNLETLKIEEQIKKGSLKALTITAMDYKTSTAISFVQGDPQCQTWERSRRRSEKTKISVEHIMGSSAIPILFPPIQIEDRFFGDGCVRNLAPCSPALHLGADKLFVIGVRMISNSAYDRSLAASNKSPSVARIVNVLLNAVLLDGVEVDIERLNRINTFLQQVPKEHHGNLNFKPVKYVFMSPSRDLGQLASDLSSKLPRVLRFVMKGLGPLQEASEIISYLLFEREYTSQLIEVGYEDALKRSEEIVQFFTNPN
jgi:NTE family protein